MLYGAHVSSAGGISSAIDRAEELGCTAVQVFTQSPRMWKPTAHADEEVERFRARREEAGIDYVVCHALYLVNLASPDPEIHTKSVAAMRASLETAAAIGAEGVVFHVGSHLGSGFEAGLERAVPALRKALTRCSETTWLLMENTVGAGDTIGRSIEELAALYNALDAHERLGICLDSCHLYASGYDVTNRKELEGILREVDEQIGLARLRVLHANDSKAPLGSNRDRHDNIGAGLLGEDLGVFLAHPKLQKLPAFLEVPGTDGHGPDAEQVRKLKELHARARKKRRGGSGRKSGTSARRSATRRTQG